MNESGREYGELHDLRGIATVAEWGPLSAPVGSISASNHEEESDMAIRNKQVHPDQMFTTTTYGDIPIVSREALTEALVDMAALVDHLGGTITLVVERHPTDLPDEMVTIRAVVQWKDFVAARRQPEPVAALEVEPEPPLSEAEEAAILPFEHPEQAPAEESGSVEDEDEDLSEIPVGLR